MYIYEKKSLKATSLNIVFNAGALYEAEGKKGTMHLMEHLVCKTFKKLHPVFTKYNVSWNAYTGDEYVVFYIAGLDAYVTPEMKKEYVDSILGGIEKAVSKEEFENEKKTVLQEYGDVFADISSGSYANAMRAHFGYYDAIGKKEDIENFTYEDMVAAKKEFFTKPARIIEIGPTKTDFSYVEFEKERHTPLTLKFSKKQVFESEEIASAEKTAFNVFSKKLVKKSDYPYLNVAQMMLNRGLESPLYQEIREKRGLSYFSQSSISTFINKGLISFISCTDDNNVEELENVYKDFFSDVKKHLTKERFDDIMQKFDVGKENRKIFRYSDNSDLIRKGDICMPKNMSKVTFEKVVEVAEKYLNSKEIFIYKSKPLQGKLNLK